MATLKASQNGRSLAASREVAAEGGEKVSFFDAASMIQAAMSFATAT